jgi:hypothetical protein
MSHAITSRASHIATAEHRGSCIGLKPTSDPRSSKSQEGHNFFQATRQLVPDWAAAQSALMRSSESRPLQSVPGSGCGIRETVHPRGGVRGWAEVGVLQLSCPAGRYFARI